MSKIDEMLKRLCPEGVEQKFIKDICIRHHGTPITAGRMAQLNKYGAPIRVFAAGSTLATVDEGVLPETDIVREPGIVVKARGYVDFAYCNKPFTHKGELWSYTLRNQKPSLKFLFYYLKSRVQELQVLARSKSVKLPQLSTGDTDNLRIPFPPRQVQDEIAKALDAMDAAVKALEEERAARQEQFEAVMEDVFEKLLSQGVKQEPFSIHSEYIRGITYSKNDETENEKDSFVVLRANNITLECCDINLEDVKRVASTVRIKREQFLKLGDVLICAGSGSKAHIGKVAYIDKNYEFAFGGFMAVIRSDAMLNNKFTFYVLRSNGFKSFLKRRLSGGAAINNLDASIMNEFSVPVPPRPVQDEIVKVLDAMDAVVKALDEEIAARREQFAGWLEKLMRFEMKEVAVA